MGKQEKRELSKLWSAATWRRFVIRNASLTRAVTKRSQVAALQKLRSKPAGHLLGRSRHFVQKATPQTEIGVVRIRGKHERFQKYKLKGC
jgi:hypothetical protein